VYNLVAAKARDGSAQHSFGRGVDNDLHEPLCLAAFARTHHSRHHAPSGESFDPRRPHLMLGHPHPAQGWAVVAAMSAAPPMVSHQRSQREIYREGSLCHRQNI
jgi:hypothetical protein